MTSLAQTPPPPPPRPGSPDEAGGKGVGGCPRPGAASAPRGQARRAPACRPNTGDPAPPREGDNGDRRAPPRHPGATAASQTVLPLPPSRQLQAPIPPPPPGRPDGCSPLKTMAAEAPITAKKEAYSGLALEDMAARAGPGRGEAPLGPGEREGGGGGGGGRLRRGAGPPQAALGHKMAETGREGGGGRRGGGRLRAAQGRGPAAGGRERARGVAAQSSVPAGVRGGPGAAP